MPDIHPPSCPVIERPTDSLEAEVCAGIPRLSAYLCAYLGRLLPLWLFAIIHALGWEFSSSSKRPTLSSTKLKFGTGPKIIAVMAM